MAEAYRTLAQPLGAIPNTEGMPKAEELAMKALDLDSTLAEAHATLGDVNRYYHWDWDESERELSLAMELDPSSFRAHQSYAFLMTQLGRHDEASTHQLRAQQLDPLNLRTRSARTSQLSLARRYQETIEQCKALIAVDRNSVREYGTLAGVYELQGFYREATEPRQRWLIFPHATLGDVNRYYHWDWDESERELSLAMELDPSSFRAHQSYAFLMTQLGRHDEASTHQLRAQQLDPLNLRTRSARTSQLSLARRYQETIEQCKALIAVDRNSVREYGTLAGVYELQGFYREATEPRQRWLILRWGASEEDVAGLLDAYETSGKEGYIRWLLDYWQEKARTEYVQPNVFARLYSHLGERDQAFEWLNKVHDQRIAVYLKVNAWYDPIRDDPRFHDLLRRMNLEP